MDRWSQVKAVFAKASELEGHHRVAYLDIACAHDPELRAEVEALLIKHDQTGALLRATVSPRLFADGHVVSERFRIVKMMRFSERFAFEDFNPGHSGL